MKTFELQITPVPKPRQTRSDKWKKRPSVMRYRAFADELRYLLSKAKKNGFEPNRYFINVLFVLPMPASWSKKQKEVMDNTPHMQRPDCDNLVKALSDAFLEEDSTVYKIFAEKRWGVEGKIVWFLED